MNVRSTFTGSLYDIQNSNLTTEKVMVVLLVLMYTCTSIDVVSSCTYVLLYEAILNCIIFHLTKKATNGTKLNLIISSKHIVYSV